MNLTDEKAKLIFVLMKNDASTCIKAHELRTRGLSICHHVMRKNTQKKNVHQRESSSVS